MSSLPAPVAQWTQQPMYYSNNNGFGHSTLHPHPVSATGGNGRGVERDVKLLFQRVGSSQKMLLDIAAALRADPSCDPALHRAITAHGSGAGGGSGTLNGTSSGAGGTGADGLCVIMEMY